MTDRNREELIEKAAKAIHDAHMPTTGVTPPWEREQEVWRETYRDFARAALAVFEQAHAPTSDQREALRDAFDEMHRITEGGCDTRGEDVADMVITLGFRRTVQGEPTDAQVLAALNAHYRVRLAQFEAMPGDPEVQGDAHSLEEYSSKSIDRMRAALRAAAKVQEGKP